MKFGTNLYLHFAGSVVSLVFIFGHVKILLVLQLGSMIVDEKNRKDGKSK